MAGVSFEWAFRAGDILTLIGYLGVGIYFFSDIKATFKIVLYRLEGVEKHQEIMDASIEDLKRTYADGKVQDNKIERLEDDGALMRKEISDLRNGRGYIQHAIDGQWTRHGKVSDG